MAATDAPNTLDPRIKSGTFSRAPGIARTACPGSAASKKCRSSCTSSANASALVSKSRRNAREVSLAGFPERAPVRGRCAPDRVFSSVPNCSATMSGAMVGQHDSTRTHTDRARAAGDMSNQDGGSRHSQHRACCDAPPAKYRW